jgi:replicative DNA helicase
MNVEDAVIGLCMRSQTNLHRVIGMGVTPETFEGLGEVFQVLLESDAAGAGVDLNDIGPRLPKGYLTKVVEIIENAPLTHKVEYWAEALLRQYWLRKARKRLTDVLMDISRHDGFDTIDAIREAILQSSEDCQIGTSTTFDAKSLAYALVEEIQEAIDGKRRPIQSGIRAIDTLIGGFYGGELYVIAARPGVGKTTIGLQFALTACRDQEKKCVFLTVEMSPVELIRKVVSSLSKVDGQKLRNGRFADDDFDMIWAATNQLSKLPLRVNATAGRNIATIESELRGLHRQGFCEFAVIDYVQLIKAAGKHQSRVTELTEITGRIKMLAQELQIPILLLSQINRAAVATRDSIPGVHHLKDSGSLEQDADAVLILHRDDDEKSEDKGKYWLNIAKNRHGNMGIFELLPNLATNEFKDIGGQDYGD